MQEILLFASLRLNPNLLHALRRVQSAHCSRLYGEHKVLFSKLSSVAFFTSSQTAEESFEAGQAFAAEKWTTRSPIDNELMALLASQGWDCTCGRNLKHLLRENTRPDTFRAVSISNAAEPILACDTCYTDYYLKMPGSASLSGREVSSFSRHLEVILLVSQEWDCPHG